MNPNVFRPRLLRLTLRLVRASAPARLIRARGFLYNRCVRRGVYVIDPLALRDLDMALGEIMLPGVRAGGGERPGPAAGEPWRLGLLGDFAGLLSFPRDLLAARPCGVDLHVYDCPEGEEPGVPGYADFGRYRRLDLGGRRVLELDLLRAAGRVIRADGLHGLVIINAKRTPHLVLLAGLLASEGGMRLAAINCGCDFLAAPGVTRQNLVSPPPGWGIRHGELRRNDGGARLSGIRFTEAAFHYDRRRLDLAESAEAAGRARRPLIVYAGRLMKLDSRPLIRAIAGMLLVDPLRRFVFWGRGSAAELARILRRFAACGVAERVVYRGEFRAGRGPDGELLDADGWRAAVAEMSRAALYVNPFPVWGGSSVVEAYVLGIPVVHMLPGPGDGRGLLDIYVPGLAVPEACARSVGEYASLGARLMSDAELAGRVLRVQEEIARRVTDRERFWRAVIADLLGWDVTNWKE